MKILIVDDNPNKVKPLIGHLVSTARVDRSDIAVAHNAADARSQLAARGFDLMILDILLPRVFESEPTTEASVELLQEITAGRISRVPRYIVGLTAFKNAAAEVRTQFSDLGLYQVIEFDATRDTWLVGIANCIQKIRNSEAEVRHPEFMTDLCIVTALSRPEMDAILKNVRWNWTEPSRLDDTTYVHRGSFQSGDRTCSCVAAVASRPGMVATSLLSSKLIERLRPRFIVMAGICAGVEGKVNLGDPILGDPTWDYQSGKRVSNKGVKQFAIAPVQRDIPQFVRTNFERLNKDQGFWDDMRAAWHERVDWVPKVVMGPMGTGSSVIADSDLVEEVRHQHRGLVAIEMEAYGLYEAALLASYPRPTAFALKSACDFADQRKDDTFQAYAAYTSAATVKEYFERYMHELAALAGT